MCADWNVYIYKELSKVIKVAFHVNAASIQFNSERYNIVI